jgi:hypothetical protein
MGESSIQIKKSQPDDCDFLRCDETIKIVTVPRVFSGLHGTIPLAHWKQSLSQNFKFQKKGSTANNKDCHKVIYHWKWSNLSQGLFHAALNPMDKGSSLHLADQLQYLSSELPALLLAQLQHFFENYKALEQRKWVKKS